MYNIYDYNNDDNVYNINDDYRIKMLICKYIQQKMQVIIHDRRPLKTVSTILMMIII